MTLDSEAGESAEGSRVISFIEAIFLISLSSSGKVPATDRSLFSLNYMFYRCALMGRFFAAAKKTAKLFDSLKSKGGV